QAGNCHHRHFIDPFTQDLYQCTQSRTASHDVANPDSHGVCRLRAVYCVDRQNHGALNAQPALNSAVYHQGWYRPWLPSSAQTEASHGSSSGLQILNAEAARSNSPIILNGPEIT